MVYVNRMHAVPSILCTLGRKKEQRKERKEGKSRGIQGNKEKETREYRETGREKRTEKENKLRGPLTVNNFCLEEFS